MPITGKFIDQQEFHRRARAGRGGGTGVFRPEARALREIDADKRVVRFVFSDGSVDRMGDTIDPNGWELADYRRNPIVLFAHSSVEPPIGRTINVHSDGTRLLGDVQFADGDTYDFADTIFKLVKGGFIKAGSVGFLPLEWSYVEGKDRPWGIDFKRQSLLEFSIVPVPANAGALVEARAKGIDTRPLQRWAERTQSHDPARAQRVRIAEAAAAHARAMRVVEAAEAECARVEREFRIRRAERARAEALRVLGK